MKGAGRLVLGGLAVAVVGYVLHRGACWSLAWALTCPALVVAVLLTAMAEGQGREEQRLQFERADFRDLVYGRLYVGVAYLLCLMLVATGLLALAVLLGGGR